MCHRSSPAARERQETLFLPQYFSSVLPKVPPKPLQSTGTTELCRATPNPAQTPTWVVHRSVEQSLSLHGQTSCCLRAF